jgi:hypothetical protein
MVLCGRLVILARSGQGVLEVDLVLFFSGAFFGGLLGSGKVRRGWSTQ